MKNTLIESPVELVVAICDDKKGEEIELYLNSVNLNAGLLFMGKGTAESEIADLFGFGMNNRDIVAVIVPKTKTDKVVKKINEITGIETDSYGLTFVMPLSSASSTLMDLAKINMLGTK